MQISFIGSSRADVRGKTDREQPAYVRFPVEHPDRAKGLCGFVQVHTHGARHVAQGWHDECSGVSEEPTFRRGISSAFVFYHRVRTIRTCVHGDEFARSGS